MLYTNAYNAEGCTRVESVLVSLAEEMNQSMLVFDHGSPALSKTVKNIQTDDLTLFSFAEYDT